MTHALKFENLFTHTLSHFAFYQAEKHPERTAYKNKIFSIVGNHLRRLNKKSLKTFQRFFLLMCATIFEQHFACDVFVLREDSGARYYCTNDPGGTFFSGLSITVFRPPSVSSIAYTIMPLLSTPFIFRGAKLVITGTCLPTIASGA